jgi:hypothetical protein
MEMEQPVLHPRITANELPLGMSANGGGLNRSTPHLTSGKKDGVRPIRQRFRNGMLAAEKTLLWDR